jgi:cyclase
MLRSRLIPCLLVHKGGLYKTTKFKDHRYVGDPINAVRIFNEKEVDELIVLDIDASKEGREPNYSLISSLAVECRMPLCYGGGITSPEQVERIVGLGVEKVAMSAGAIADPGLISESARRVGRQSVVFVIDAKTTGVFSKRYEVFTHNGSRTTGRSAVEVARTVQDLGVGEIVVNSIDRDGTGEGYDQDLIGQVKSAVGVPVTALGGAGSLTDVGALTTRFGLIGAAAGSLFVFKGKYRAVLIQYPSPEDKRKVLSYVG